MKMKKLPLDVSALTNWFLGHRRDLPWRRNPTPYAVWISEVMLQQTQVSVVIAYFQKWMELFPTIQSLADAPIEQVIKTWEGLGYYSRARNLHRAANVLVHEHRGELPSKRQELEKIPGLGPYTVGAILSFAFHQRAAAVDGNVVRVLTRFAAVEEVVCTQKTKQWLWEYAEEILPEEKPWLVVEGLIELGAAVCTRQPKCFICPLAHHCQGLKKGIADLLPIKKKRAAVTHLERHVAVIVSDGFFLLKKGKKGSVMEDLYEFPYIETSGEVELETYLSRTLKLDVEFQKELPIAKHSFTRYQAELYPSLWLAVQRKEVKQYEWVPASALQQLPFSAGHRQILKSLEADYADSTH